MCKILSNNILSYNNIYSNNRDVWVMNIQFDRGKKKEMKFSKENIIGILTFYEQKVKWSTDHIILFDLRPKIFIKLDCLKFIEIVILIYIFLKSHL